MCEWALAEWAVPLCFSDDLRENPQHAVKPQSFNWRVAQSPNGEWSPFGLSGSLSINVLIQPVCILSISFQHPFSLFYPSLRPRWWQTAGEKRPACALPSTLPHLKCFPHSLQFRQHRGSFTFALAPMAQCLRLAHAGFSIQWCHAHKVKGFKGHRERCDVIYDLSVWQGTFVHSSCC